MNKICGLVLSMGEKTTYQSIERLKRQTIPLEKIILIKNVSPWSKAFSAGLSRVNTEFFINCNADMLLYLNCIERLLSYMQKDVGLVIGRLEDPLYGSVLGIKLYRTESLKSINLKENSIMPDFDLAKDMQQDGWGKIYANKDNPLSADNAEILGIHCPEYSPLYTFKKFKTLGTRITKRGTLNSLSLHWEPLKKSNHPMAKIAIVALSIGSLCTYEKNMLDFHDVEKEFISLKNLLHKVELKNNSECNLNNFYSLKWNNSPGILFKKSFIIGEELRLNLKVDKFSYLLSAILKSENKYYWSAAIGLCNGFFHNPTIANLDINKEWSKIRDIK